MGYRRRNPFSITSLEGHKERKPTERFSWPKTERSGPHDCLDRIRFTDPVDSCFIFIYSPKTSVMPRRSTLLHVLDSEESVSLHSPYLVLCLYSRKITRRVPGSKTERSRFHDYSDRIKSTPLIFVYFPTHRTRNSLGLRDRYD